MAHGFADDWIPINHALSEMLYVIFYTTSHIYSSSHSAYDAKSTGFSERHIEDLLTVISGL
jgi:hypothetical protein